MERVLEGVDASRRVAWAQKYAADQRIQELEQQVLHLRSRVGTCNCRIKTDIRQVMATGSQLSRARICELVGGKRQAVWDALGELIESGDIVRVDGGKRLVWPDAVEMAQ